MRTLGTRGAMAVTLSVYAFQTVWLGAATRAWQFWAILPTFVFNLLRNSALETAMTVEVSQT